MMTSGSSAPQCAKPTVQARKKQQQKGGRGNEEEKGRGLKKRAQISFPKKRSDFGSLKEDGESKGGQKSPPKKNHKKTTLTWHRGHGKKKDRGYKEKVKSGKLNCWGEKGGSWKMGSNATTGKRGEGTMGEVRNGLKERGSKGHHTKGGGRN